MAEADSLEFWTEWLGNAVYYFSQPAFPGLPNTLKEVKNCWKRGQIWVSDRGAASAGSSGNAVYLTNVNAGYGGMTTNGSLFYHLSKYWSAGTGNAVRNGVVLFAGNGKLRLDGVDAGLDQPSAPDFAATATASTKFNGTYSVRVCAFRTTTGAVSNPSPPSPVISVKNKKGLITFPAVPTGATHWLIFGTLRGRGLLGPHYRVTSIAAEPVATATKEVDWIDGDLGDLPSFTNDKPPSCTHAFVLGGILCVVSSTGILYPSKINLPEAYDITQAVRIPSGEAVVGVTGRGTEGGMIIGTRDSICLAVATGSDIASVLIRGIFENTGIGHGNGFCWAFDTLYGMSNTGTPFRSQGSEYPDSSFAQPVIKRMKDLGFTGTNTIVVHDQRNGCVLFASGSIAMPFMLDSQEWSGDITVPATVAAGVAYNGQGLLDCGGTLYALDANGGNPSGGWSLQSPYQPCAPSPYTHHSKTLRYSKTASDSAVVVDFLKNLSASSVGGVYPHTTTPPHDNFVGSCRAGNKSLALKISGTLGGQQWDGTIAQTYVEPIER